MSRSATFLKQIINRACKQEGFILYDDKPYKKVWKKEWVTVVVGNYRCWIFNMEKQVGQYSLKYEDDYNMLTHDLKELVPGISFYKSFRRKTSPGN